jgi:hypothetical protein
VLEEMFTRHGTPSIMSLRLNQIQLRTSVFIDFCKKNKINLQLETTGYEQAENDLQIQKNNIIKIIKDAKRENRVYKATLREYLLAYRKKINSTAGVNLQRKIKFKRELQQRLCQLQVIDQIKLKFEKNQENCNENNTSEFIDHVCVNEEKCKISEKQTCDLTSTRNCHKKCIDSPTRNRVDQ